MPPARAERLKASTFHMLMPGPAKFQVLSGKALSDARPPAARQSQEAGGIKRLIAVHHIDEMMRDRGALSRGRFRGANVQTAINLHRIGGDNFTAELLGEQQGNLGLTHCGRAPDEQQRRLVNGRRHSRKPEVEWGSNWVAGRASNTEPHR